MDFFISPVLGCRELRTREQLKFVHVGDDLQCCGLTLTAPSLNGKQAEKTHVPRYHVCWCDTWKLRLALLRTSRSCLSTVHVSTIQFPTEDAATVRPSHLPRWGVNSSNTGAAGCRFAPRDPAERRFSEQSANSG